MAKRTGDKYTAILDAAVRVIATHGYHGAQMSRIARTAGVAIGTLYLYFDNKQDLLLSLFRERLGGIIAAAKSRMDVACDPRDKLRQLVEYHLRALGHDWEFAVVTQIELRQPERGMRRQITEIMRQYFAVIDGVVSEGQAAGVFRRDLDPKLMRNLIFGTLDQQVTAWVMSGGRFDLTELVEPITGMFLDGVATEK